MNIVMVSEPKRHHYIPQFILKNFNDENSQIYYWDIANKELQKRNTRSVFMNMHMYRDDNNYPNQPTIIESALADFECEISKIINGKLLEDNQVVLKRNELEQLRIFLSLLSFRSNLRMEQYKNNRFDNATRDVLKEFSKEDFESLWKKELFELAKARSFEEIRLNQKIDPIIKMDFFNDLTGKYMTLVDARGGDFIITDIYPTLEIFPLKVNANIHLHCIYPISPTRLLLLNNTMFRKEVDDPILNKMVSFSQIKGNMIIPPKNRYVLNGVTLPNDEYIYKVNKIYDVDVQYITALQLNEAKVGVVFRDPKRIVDSVVAFNRRKDIKQSFPELESELLKF